jgi:serine/threonine protein kinase
MISAHIDERFPINIPMVFSHYKYIKNIGSGAFSLVILVENMKNQKQYAAKVVSREFLINEGAFDRFEQEIRLLQTFDHKNIVKIEEIVYEPKLIFVVMEYCSRGELFSFIVNNGSLEDAIVKRFLFQISEALVYLHERNIAHRDIKPENILLDAELNIKVADFGLCHTTNKNTMLSTPCGSPFYAPPEVVSGAKYDGKMSDMWSLGVVLFTMCTGSLPWREENQTKLLNQIVNSDFNIPLSVPPHYREIIGKLMNPNPSERPTALEITEIPWLLESQQSINDFNPYSLPHKVIKQRSQSYGYDDMEVVEPTSLSHSSITKKKLIVRPEVRKKKVTASVELSPILDLVRKVPNQSRLRPKLSESFFEI